MPAIIEKKATTKWVTEFNYLRSIATGNLAQFLDFITCASTLSLLSPCASSLP